MHIRNHRQIHQQAAQALAAAHNPRKIALYYGAASVGLAVLATVISVWLNNGISESGGLGGIGLRSVLDTGQTFLPLLQLAISSCLGLGYQYTMLNIVRGKPVDAGSLAEGFRRFGPLFGASALQFAIYMILGIVSMYVGVFIFLMTPFANAFVSMVEPMIASGSILSDPSVMMNDAQILAAAESLKGALWIYLAVFALLVTPVYFRFRMTLFALADDPRRGGVIALLQSRRMLRRNCLHLLKLDLSMWWYYLAQLVAGAVCYGDVLLPLVGITLPFTATFSYYLFFALSLVLQMLLYCFALNRVTAVYAVAYDVLRESAEASVQQMVPHNPA